MPSEPAPAERANAAAPAAGEVAAFYRYRDTRGQLVIVDEWSRVPASARPSAQRIELAAPSAPALPAAREVARSLHVPSFVAGAACALALALLLLALRRSLGRLLRLGFVLLALGLGGGLYFGWARNLAGQSSERLASPQQLIDDARQAVEKMNQRRAEQDRALRELEAER